MTFLIKCLIIIKPSFLQCQLFNPPSFFKHQANTSSSDHIHLCMFCTQVQGCLDRDMFVYTHIFCVRPSYLPTEITSLFRQRYVCIYTHIFFVRAPYSPKEMTSLFRQGMFVYTLIFFGESFLFADRNHLILEVLICRPHSTRVVSHESQTFTVIYVQLGRSALIPSSSPDYWLI